MGVAEDVAREQAAVQRLKILYVDTEKVWRGGQEQVYTLISGMLKRGHSVWLAAPPESPLATRVRQIGAGFLPFRMRVAISPRAVLRIRAFLRRHDFDLIHFNSQRPLLVGGAAWLLSGRRQVRVCSRRVNFPLRTRFSRLQFNFFADCVVTVSASIRDTLIHDGVKKHLIEVIYEGADVEALDSRPSPSPLNGQGGLVVGIVAHLSGEKGHDTLIDAMSILLPSHRDLSLLIVGDGILREHLEQRAQSLGISESIRFLGFREDADSIMKHFDVFCLPSLSEGLSSAILAAMTNRLPVVATSVGGIPELVIQGETGYLVPPRDPRRLAQALGRLLDSPRLRARFGEAGRRRIEEQFTLKRKIESFENLYCRLLGSAPIG